MRTTTQARLAGRTVLIWSALLFGSVGLGIYGDLGSLLNGSWGLVAELGLPWVILALLWGTRSASPTAGALLGIFGVLVGLASYVVFKASRYGYDSVDQLLRYDSGMWLVLAIAVCGPAGYVGPGMKKPGNSREIAVGLLAGAACAESFVWRVVVTDPDLVPRIALPVIYAEGSIGILVLAVAVLTRWCRPIPLLAFSAAWAGLGVLAGRAFFGSPL